MLVYRYTTPRVHHFAPNTYTHTRMVTPTMCTANHVHRPSRSVVQIPLCSAPSLLDFQKLPAKHETQVLLHHPISPTVHKARKTPRDHANNSDTIIVLSSRPYRSTINVSTSACVHRLPLETNGYICQNTTPWILDFISKKCTVYSTEYFVYYNGRNNRYCTQYKFSQWNLSSRVRRIFAHRTGHELRRT